jgi:histidinol-phosphate aminotransferase
MYIHIRAIYRSIRQSEYLMSSQITHLRPELASLSTYNSGLTLEDVVSRAQGLPIAKLGSNENPYGPPEEVQRAMLQALSRTHFYPDPRCRRLAQEISERTRVPTDGIIFGDGSEDLLNVLARCLLRPGDKMVTLYPSFPLHEDYAQMMGAEVVRIGLTQERRIDVQALLAAAARPSRLILLANPMNPTGLWLEPTELDALLEAQHAQTVLCLDEAYVEYAMGEGYLAGTERLMAHRKPLLILRTFSKAYGLAALRIGYGLCNDRELLRGMNLVRTPFNVNGVAQAAAIAALLHSKKMRESVAEVLAERRRVTSNVKGMGLEVFPSKGNFLFIRTKQDSVTLADALIDRGVIVKPWKQKGYEKFFRVSIGLPRENDQFLEALRALI